jgi:hypothetical protein
MTPTINEIRALAADSATERRSVPLSTDELNRKREAVLKLLDEQENDEVEFAVVRKEFLQRSKDRRITLKSLRASIRRRDEEREVLVHYVPEYDRGIMNLYDDDANFLGSRRLTADERQITIHQLSKAV